MKSKMRHAAMLVLVLTLHACAIVYKPVTPVLESASCQIIARAGVKTFFIHGYRAALGLFRYSDRSRNHLQAFVWVDGSWRPVNYICKTFGTYSEVSWFGRYGHWEGDKTKLLIMEEKNDVHN